MTKQDLLPSPEEVQTDYSHSSMLSQENMLPPLKSQMETFPTVRLSMAVAASFTMHLISAL